MLSLFLSVHHTEPCDDRDKRVPFKYLKFSKNSGVLIAITSRYDLFIFDDLNDFRPNNYQYLLCIQFFCCRKDIYAFNLCDKQYWCLYEGANNCCCFNIAPHHELTILIGTKFGSIFIVNLSKSNIFSEFFSI